MLLSAKKLSPLPFAKEKFSNLRQQLGGLVYSCIKETDFKKRPPLDPDNGEDLELINVPRNNAK